MIADGPTTVEMKDALGSLDTSFRRMFGRGFDSAEAFADLEARGADLTYHAALREAYRTVTAERVKAVAAKYLAPDKLLFLCVGNVDGMKPGDGVHADRLEDFGKATVHEAAAAAPAVAIDPNSPGAVATRILEALKAGDIDTVKGHGAKTLLERFEKNPESVDQLRGFVRMFAEATFSDPDEKIEGDSAEVTFKTTVSRGGNEMDLVLAFGMVKEEGSDAWKCESFGMKR